MTQFPLVEEISPLNPLDVFAHLKSQDAIFLDSATTAPQGRYSFIACSPFQMLTCKNGVVQLDKTVRYENPFTVLQEELAKFSLPHLSHLPPFQGGVAGMLGYELGGYLEKLLPSIQDDLGFPEMILGFYDVVIAWDHWEGKSWIFSSGFPQMEPSQRMDRAVLRLAWMAKEIRNCKPLEVLHTVDVDGAITSNFTRQGYEAAVRQVIEYIRAGDIFEANISQRFEAKLNKEFTPFDLYRCLRQHNPAPFAAYLQYGHHTIASASPERFLQLRKDKVQVRPIKGTRSRHSDSTQDQLLAMELTKSEKDRAENIMIVDLMRNDLSRVCSPHTIRVPQLCGLESFATVHHLVSVVEGSLQPEKNALDLLKATFPGGSITGAPKIRAMEIITEVERLTRGPYCGSIGYIGFNGDMDLSIVIRTFVMHKNFVTFHAGGAITIDSDPAEEYQETLIKAQALHRRLKVKSGVKNFSYLG